ncbi:LPD7 domain-containing protein [Klebsiella quasipneumoniae]|uniref:LPD7 domain-containing protein n=1 Tax=Klebsiella quasipneumoniae TaxID=1463165 RepID=UPI001C93FB97|nr:LPD7 domain-containing protein [Klebsiella quasipneumoniae]
MIVRFGGGNSGIAEYLEKGRKADRDYSREEMDHRLILSGDLSLTDTIIDSIEDNGQMRYLHITLSFHETEISRETLQAVTDEYKTILMNAYHEEEYSFYAEAHLPKLTHIADNKTGELIERKPHIHIVVPRTNLVTGKSLNPVGDATHKITQERLDAIQEHINNKYGLASPKDGVRVSDENHAAVLSRTKGDLFREKNNRQKNEIFRRLDKENVRTVKEFGAMLAQYGEVRTRNAGKPTEYFAVKFGNDAKFTNLKNPLFSRSYIEDRRLPLSRPSEAQIASRLEGWKNQTSHEIKHVFSKGEKLREHYKSLTQNDKAVFLQERISRYDREHQIESGHSSQPGGRAPRNESGSAESSRKHPAENRVRLSRLSERTLVYGIPGRGRNEAPDSDKLLQSAPRSSLAKQQENRERHAEKLRWADGAGRRVGETSIAYSSAATDIFLRHIERHKELIESEKFAQIKKDIEPERFLSYLKDKYNLNPANHKISYASDGSPRFRSDKRNLNASDFLTKKMNLSWDEAKIILTDIYDQQQQNKSYSAVNNTTARLSSDAAAERRSSLTEARNEIRGWVRNERKELFAQIKEMRSQLREIPAHQRSLAEGVIVYKKLTGLETIKEKEKESRNAISQYHSHWHERSEPMKALDKLNDLLNSDSEDGIKPETPRHNLKHAVEAQLHVQNMRNDNQQLKDLVMDKGRFGVDYRDMNTQQVVFSDKGNHIVAGKNPSDKEIGLMMDYAKEKYGGILKLTGSDDFKSRCANVAAENGLNVILKPSEYHEQMLNKRQEIDLAKQNAVQATSAETSGAAPGATAAAQDGLEQVSKEQLRQAVETLPDVTTPSQLKTAVEAATAAAAASSGAKPQALPEAATDAQEMSRDQLRAAVESLPERVSPSQLRDALAAAALTVAAADTQSVTAATSEAANTHADNVEATASPVQTDRVIQAVAAAPETAPDEALRAAVESLPDSVSPTELKQAVDAVNQEHNAQASLRGIREISSEAISGVNASILEKEAIVGTAGVSRDYETGTYDVLIAGRDAQGNDEVYTLATVKTSEEATRLATLVNNQEPGQLAQAIRTEMANEHAQSAEAVKYGYTPAEASAMAAVADINKEVPGASLSASSLKDFHAGHFTVEKTDPFSNASTFEVVGATKDHAADEQTGDVRLATYDTEEQARAVVYSLNGVNTDALSSAMDKQGRYEAMTSFEQLKNGIRDANFAEALPVDIDSENVQYKEIAPNTWNIEVPDSTGQGHVLLGGFKGNEDYARLVMDKVTRIDLNALGAAMEHRAHDKESHDLHQAQEAAEKQVHKQDDFGME